MREDSETLRASLQLVTDSSDDCQWRIGETSQVIRDSGDHHTSCSTNERSITASLASWQCEDLSTVSVRCSNKFAMDNVIPEVAGNLSNLRILNLSFCYYIGYKSLKAIAKECKKLVYVSFSNLGFVRIFMKIFVRILKCIDLSLRTRGTTACGPR